MLATSFDAVTVQFKLNQRFLIADQFNGLKFSLYGQQQGPDLYAFIGFVGPDGINYMCYLISNQILILIINLNHHHQSL